MCMLHAGTKLQSTTFITVSLLQPKQILICWFYDASFSTLVWPIDMLYFICMHVWWKLRLMHFFRTLFVPAHGTVQATLLKAYFGKSRWLCSAIKPYVLYPSLSLLLLVILVHVVLTKKNKQVVIRSSKFIRISMTDLHLLGTSNHHLLVFFCLNHVLKKCIFNIRLNACNL